MNIVFVGAGNLATCLACALHSKGHRITAVYSRTMASATALAALVRAEATDDVRQLPVQADAFIVAVKDAALASLVPLLAQGRESQRVFHTAGSMPMKVFEGFFRDYGVIYPMQTFSKNRAVDFQRVPFFLEASSKAAMDTAEELARSVSDCVQNLSGEDRKHLHLAAVFACNFANHCYALSADILQKRHLPFSVMLPLIEETASKVGSMPPRTAQTGPAVRYDENIINAQMQLLQKHPMVQEVYDVMSRSIHQLAEMKS